MPTNRQFLIDHLPTGKLTLDVFRLSQGAMPAAADGEVLVRTRYVSLDAANRAWMWGATYRSALKAGDVMAGGAMAEVVESKAPGFKPGDLVWGDTGWQDYAALPARHLEKLGSADPVTHLMSVYGVAGLTGYFGLLECAWPKAGETVVVSAAAGSVGMFVGQIAKMPLREENGRLFGPGVFDMKAGFAVAMLAVRALGDQEGARPHVVMLWTTDEEIGSGTSRVLIEAEARRSHAVLVLEPSLPGGAAKAKKMAAPDKVELYDLDADLGQKQNVAGAHADVVAQLLRHVEAARDDLGDVLTKRPGKNRRPPGEKK